MHSYRESFQTHPYSYEQIADTKNTSSACLHYHTLKNSHLHNTRNQYLSVCTKDKN